MGELSDAVEAYNRNLVIKRIKIIVKQLEEIEKDPALHGMEQCDVSEAAYILNRIS